MTDWDPFQDRRQLDHILAAQVELKPGDRVRLRPRKRGADIMDIALAGRSAVIVAIEQDYENRIHIAVAVDDDPGRDLGHQGKPGHRFFFDLDEVEPIAEGR